MVKEEQVKEEDDDEDYIDEEAEYSPKSEFSKPKIVYEAMQKCINARGDEMKAGYYNTKITPEGIPTKTWIKDSRQVYIGTVIALKGLLNPELILNKRHCKRINAHLTELNDLYDQCAYTQKVRETVDQRVVWKNTKTKYIPEIDEDVIVPDTQNSQNAMQMKGGWNPRVNYYWNKSVDIHDGLFACMNDLINHLNYFKQKISY